MDDRDLLRKLSALLEVTPEDVPAALERLRRETELAEKRLKGLQ